MDDFDSKIHVIMRQTNYTYEEAKKKLENHNNNITEVIRLYLSSDICTIVAEPKHLSMNQQIYKEIRTLMDDNEVCKQK
jgi:hypothetical protein